MKRKLLGLIAALAVLASMFMNTVPSAAAAEPAPPPVETVVSDEAVGPTTFYNKGLANCQYLSNDGYTWNFYCGSAQTPTCNYNLYIDHNQGGVFHIKINTNPISGGTGGCYAVGGTYGGPFLEAWVLDHAYPVWGWDTTGGFVFNFISNTAVGSLGTYWPCHSCEAFMDDANYEARRVDYWSSTDVVNANGYTYYGGTNGNAVYSRWFDAPGQTSRTHGSFRAKNNTGIAIYGTPLAFYGP